MTILTKMKIGNRLALGFAIVLGLSILTTLIGILKLNAVADAAERMLDEPIKKERLASDWSRNIDVAVNRTTAIAKSSDASLASFFARKAEETTKSTSEIVKKIEPLLSREQEKQAFAKAMEIRKTYLATRDQVIKLKQDGRLEEANALLDKSYLPAAEAYQATVAEFVTAQRDYLDKLAADIAVIKQESRNRVILLALLCVAIGVASAWWLTRSITRPMRNALAVARRVADGDLTGRVEIESSDEVGQLQQALKDMNNNLQRIVSDIRGGTDTIATASSQIASGNLDLSSRTEQQASSLEETASSMEELTSTVKQSADNARQANQLALSASEVAGRGGAVVTQVVSTMASINESSRKIVDIIGVIDGIAFQTNILALNAAVEAARAGEQGRGFAVVASEVRSLAQRSANAAKEIKTLISDSVEKVDDGARLVDQAGATMNEIVESVRRVSDIIGEITAASEEQRVGIEQINQAIVQMDQVTQQNASLVEQAAAAAEAMQDQASGLAQSVRVFKIDGMQSSAVALPAVRQAKSVPAVGRPAPARTAPVLKKPASGKRPAALPGHSSADGWEEF
ncbi:methyl-accepting chemotaxis sensory transducer [Noviherbaspirillum humi]|uniref:Methyl-accepting chemotaxis sensory transducer n=1 Tax=Noviherbaspirillum humi TaxID=1688639 RepID=A0A239M120_9BURK|nr:methyl-accepting chemotaxis protein [Noviherbaspirillum humi]SNT35808.1 methyl-accepting chemotaxis sensory transducer [Noviherbaspirillum humi]